MVRQAGQTLAAAILAAVGIAAALPRPACACTPCLPDRVLDLAETAEAADLIVIGRQVQRGPSTGTGPDWITIRVSEVLKGSTEETRIRVDSFSGMCGYGIVVDRATYVIFLERGDDMYYAVNDGCAVHTVPVEGGEVTVDGQGMPIDEFVTLLGPDAVRTQVEDGGGLSCAGAALGLAALAGVVVMRRTARPVR
jgi:hypothetical protein